jgi:hypothetical protein
MIRKLLVVFAVLTAFTANAATYRVTLFQPGVVSGTELKAGDYRLELNDTKVTLVKGKQSVEATVKVENSDKKFASTVVRYADADGKYAIQEIRLGGTSTKLVFNP